MHPTPQEPTTASIDSVPQASPDAVLPLTPTARLEENGSVSGSAASSTAAQSAAKLKQRQKRNKPTLSCEECVERKTKCDRGRPHCLACIKRQTQCVYAIIANVIDQTVRAQACGPRMVKPPKRSEKAPSGSSDNTNSVTIPVQRDMSLSRSSTLSSGLRLLNVPQDRYSRTPHAPSPHGPASNVFGIGSEHPFANYWTRQGGLPEVISVLPSKDQADMLLARYFECVDPVYPMLHRQTFYADYEQFWSLTQGSTCDDIDGALIALTFVMLAMGTQFVTATSSHERQKSSEFYVSASHQALRVSSYLNRASLRSIQAMVLITYFLINDNHAGDAWAFAGVLIRQAYAMGLNRDPNIVAPHATIFEKQMRRKLWQAVLLQDTFLTVLLSFPPSATHTDVNVEDLIDDAESIGAENPTDSAYIRGSWTLANLVQESICSPRSLDRPICSTARQKSTLLSQFKLVHRSLPDIFRSWDAASLAASINPATFAQASPTTALGIPLPPSAIHPSVSANRRIVRQTLFLTSNYFHNVMLLHASECKEGGVPINIRGALEAAHEAIQTFFLLNELFPDEAKVWWVFNHRAFLEAICISNILRNKATEVPAPAADGAQVAWSRDWMRDPLYLRAKGNVEKMIEIMKCMASGEPGQCSEVAKTRVVILTSMVF